MDGQSEEESSIYSHSSREYSEGDPIEVLSSTQNSDQSSSETAMRSSSLKKHSPLHRTSRQNIDNCVSSVSTDPPVQVNPKGSGRSASLQDSIFGLIPAVPPQFGSMATTVTLQRSSTTLLAVPHSATCSASLMAMKCLCKSKHHIAAGDLMWCSLPQTDTGSTGPSARKGIALRSARKSLVNSGVGLHTQKKSVRGRRPSMKR